MGTSVFFYGRLACFPKREAERFARESGYRVASALRENVDLVVLGEGEPLARARARLAEEFDERSQLAFERGALEVIAESEFFRRAASARVAPLLQTSDDFVDGYTPAAVAELVGASIASIRRWNRRGLLVPIDPRARLPLFSTRETLVAKRLAFLCSTGLPEELIVRRIRAFGALGRESERAAEELPLFRATAERSTSFESDDDSSLKDADFDVGATTLQTTLSSDGRDLLFLGSDGPVDWRGQRRFDFSAFPTDGSFETPTSAPLSDDERQIALAERLAARNLTAPDASGKPAFLALFQPESRVAETFAETPVALEENSTSVRATSKEARERGATAKRAVEMCDEAWRLEREGYWEEAARVYRCASLAGGFDVGVCFRLGKVLFLLGDYSAARERFYAALELDEDCVEARVELGKTFVALGELDDALAAFRGALEDLPNDPSLRFELGKLYLALDKKAAAADEFRFVADHLDDRELADDVRRLLNALVRSEI